MHKVICLAVTTSVLVAGLATKTVAQDGGTTLEFGLISEIRSDDNWRLLPGPAAQSFRFGNTLTAGISTATRASRVDLDAGAFLHTTRIAGEADITGLSNPFAAASFMREAPGSLISLNASFTEEDRGINLSSQTGVSRTTGASGSFTFGVEQPFGGTLAASHGRTTYTGVAEDNSMTNSVSASLNLQSSPNLLFTPSASQVVYSEDNLADTLVRTSTLGLGVGAQISEVLLLNANVTTTTIDSSDFGESTAVTGSASVVREASGGTHSVGVASNLSVEGLRTEVSYDRTFDTENAAAGFGIGVARAADGSDAVTAHFNLSQDLQRGSFGGTLSREFNTDVQGNESLETALSLSLVQEFSAVANLNLSAEININEEVVGERDLDGSLSAAYNRTVAEDWTLAVGAEHRFSQDFGDARVQSNAVFLRLERLWSASR